MKKILLTIIFMMNMVIVSAGEVIATGEGETYDSALHQALRIAIEREVGVMIDSRTLIDNKQVIDDEILVNSRGFIESYKVINQHKYDGIYEVEVNAMVRSDKLKTHLMSALDKKTIVETNMNDPRIAVIATDSLGQRYQAVESEIINAISNQGFSRFVEDSSKADYIININVKTVQNKSTYSATLAVKMIAVNTSEVFYSNSFVGNSRMFTNNSPEGAIQSATKLASYSIGKEILNQAAQVEQHITINVNQFTLKQYGIENIREKIKSVVGVNDVFIRNVSATSAEIDVNFDGTSSMLANLLIKKGFVIIESKAEYIRI